MKTTKILIQFVALFTFVTLSNAAEAPSVDQIIEQANQVAYYSGDDGRSKVNMTITDNQGRKREREFVILRYDIEDGGKQNFYVYFNLPFFNI